MQLAQDISAQLPDIARSVAMPALIGGAGGGALSGYMSSRSRPMNESPSARRRRILRNALVGVVLGGTAGATLPLGAQTLGNELFGSKSTDLSPGSALSNLTGSTLAFGANNALPLGTLAYGGNKLRNSMFKERGTAMEELVKRLTGKSFGNVQVRDAATLRQVLEGGGRNSVLKELANASGEPSVKGLLRSHELLGEAGFKGNVMPDLLNKQSPGGNFWGDYKPRINTVEEISKYLRNSSSLPGRLKAFSPSGLLSRRVAENPGLVEAYLKHIRPNSARFVGRLGGPTRIAGLVGSVAIAKYLQDLAMGK